MDRGYRVSESVFIKDGDMPGTKFYKAVVSIPKLKRGEFSVVSRNNFRDSIRGVCLQVKDYLKDKGIGVYDIRPEPETFVRGTEFHSPRVFKAPSPSIPKMELMPQRRPRQRPPAATAAKGPTAAAKGPPTKTALAEFDPLQSVHLDNEFTSLTSYELLTGERIENKKIETKVVEETLPLPAPLKLKPPRRRDRSSQSETIKTTPTNESNQPQPQPAKPSPTTSGLGNESPGLASVASILDEFDPLRVASPSKSETITPTPTVSKSDSLQSNSHKSLYSDPAIELDIELPPTLAPTATSTTSHCSDPILAIIRKQSEAIACAKAATDAPTRVPDKAPSANGHDPQKNFARTVILFQNFKTGKCF